MTSVTQMNLRDQDFMSRNAVCRISKSVLLQSPHKDVLALKNDGLNIVVTDEGILKPKMSMNFN